MNKVALTGRLTRDPEIRYSTGENATAVGRFGLAVNRGFKKEGDEQTADFINCVCFGKTAEFLEKYFHKGMKADISGRIQTGSYTNKDNVKVYTTDVVVEELEFGESKSASGNTGTATTNTSSAPNDEYMNVDDDVDDDLPFN